MEFAIATLVQLAGALAMTVVSSVVAVPIMKFYTRAIPVSSLIRISIWAFWRAMLVCIVLYDLCIVGLHKASSSVSSPITFVVLCGAGCMISRDLERRGFSKPFPGIGARAIFGILVFSWVIVGVIYAILYVRA